jgi:hypothetical protein
LHSFMGSVPNPALQVTREKAARAPELGH